MRQLIVRSLSTIAVIVSVLVVSSAVTTQGNAQAQNDPIVGFARTELFFGTAKPDGAVTEQEFMAFLDQMVTPRFPDGLTWLKSSTQFMSKGGLIVKEDSFVLILLYPLEGFRESSRKINVIRRLYREQFQQESVLRVDDPFAVHVSF